MLSLTLDTINISPSSSAVLNNGRTGDTAMSGDHKTVMKGNPSQYVKLNIGGSLHYTTIGTLTKHDTMLRAMFSGRMEVLTDSEGETPHLESKETRDPKIVPLTLSDRSFIHLFIY